MMTRAAKHQASITEFLSSRSAISNLTDAEWEKVRQMSKLLKPIKESMAALGGEGYVTTSVVLPEIHYLKRIMREDDGDPYYVSKLKARFVKELTERSANLPMDFLKTATVCDPRHKRLSFLLKHERPQVYDHLKNLVKIKENSANIELSSAPTQAKRSRYEPESDESDEESCSNLQSDVDGYLALPRAEDETDVLKWWAGNNGRFPYLPLIARELLSAPATSVPCERLFSHSGYSICKERSSLKAENAEHLICLNNWLR